MEQLLGAAFPLPSESRLYKKGPATITREPWDGSWKSRRLVWDGREPARRGIRKQRNIHCWKPLPSNVSGDTSFCVILICEV
jgi:hypothetical protein